MLFSYHAQVERADRLAQLEEVLGFTRIVLEVPVVEEAPVAEEATVVEEAPAVEETTEEVVEEVVEE